ncbi:hypothetical protein [Lysobacter enzymogenes]|uniref:hypothetical protein n=1 Tax=Lysobacter enzymogenes TaxID=69 RepID=UPI0009D44855|nr:hypothetical protein [Lysobacter enzymogenes]UZW61884.1 hypothetical protein BV903_006160 [Lysobacter enzymogenes]
MEGSANNVIPLRRNGVAAEDVDAIEMIMRVHVGEEVSLRDMEMTDEPMESISRRMAAEPGATQSESRGWRFPVMQWRFHPCDGTRLVLTVIDEGRKRIFKHRVESASN